MDFKMLNFYYLKFVVLKEIGFLRVEGKFLPIF